MTSENLVREAWWRTAVIYEIALISFQDSGGDGKGDLTGLMSRIDYLKWLGVDAVWLTPIYKSPFRDLGYDISDYCSIDPAFGDLDGFDRALGALHAHGIRLILDLVPNHTANDHEWFVESRSSSDNPKADWYIWADAAENGGPPNNWLSRFGGSAGEWCETRRQYYYHSFLVEQPDLNWRNPGVQQAVADVMRFWLDRGVDGFRVDASAVLIKDALLRDNPPNPNAKGKPPPQRQTPVFTDDRPETMECIEFIRSVIDEYFGRLLCGEVQGKTDRIGHFYGTERPRLHLPLNFALLDTPWDALSLQATVDAYFNALPEDAWPVWVIGGHDKPRIASKIGETQMRILAMLLMTLKGTPFLFMGDEIGRKRVSIPPDRVRDPFEKLVPGYGLCRDPERAPLRWDASAGGGFSSGCPWLPLDPEGSANVIGQRSDERSMLSLFRALMALRREQACLREGRYEPLRAQHDVLAFKRVVRGDEMLIVLNIAAEPRRWTWQGSGRLLLSTHLDQTSRSLPDGSILLRGNEGVIIAIEPR
ncbi:MULTISPECIES: alpha-amylase family glycosyl hydrolase [unclassified Bradyrhizobium]|uniref:alpha-amylase family glycosyl hydrolase n=1 Tax=unclassified Bradyrhizobium TaxID=2631580 RepID=UPI0020B342A8|nr:MULTISPECIES: alpha-amylase family glycosyl hydrolase [unclassified Bradyrhizobium]MCP3402096.1 alpha-amylase family glycosyl hydrolase [Bradyrhizobium sp. CCGB20]MCP3410584.1 alpha-amylase family glycosyl hydrolase [Bradyrhizobium sp. CCGB01]